MKRCCVACWHHRLS